MSAVPAAEPRRVRLGFVGLGWIGRKRLDSIARDAAVEIAGLFDALPERREDAAKSYPAAANAHSLDELLSLDLDGIVIATPNGAHAAQALRCLRAGVAVFCQKPLATTGREVRGRRCCRSIVGRRLLLSPCERYG
jgi:predicted dehydrogenase